MPLEYLLRFVIARWLMCLAGLNLCAQLLLHAEDFYIWSARRKHYFTSMRK